MKVLRLNDNLSLVRHWGVWKCIVTYQDKATFLVQTHPLNAKIDLDKQQPPARKE